MTFVKGHATWKCEQLNNFNIIQDRSFPDCSRIVGGGGGWGGGGGGGVREQKGPLPKTSLTHSTNVKLGTVIPYLKKTQKNT